MAYTNTDSGRWRTHVGQYWGSQVCVGQAADLVGQSLGPLMMYVALAVPVAVVGQPLEPQVACMGPGGDSSGLG